MDWRRKLARQNWRVLSPAAAAGFAVAGVLLLWWLWRAAYAGERSVPAGLDIPLATAVLRGFGFAAAAAAVGGIYAHLRWSRPLVAALTVGLVCVPSLLLGVVGVYSSLGLAGWF